MKQSALNLIRNNAGAIKANVMAAKSRAQPPKGTVAARQRELIDDATRIAELMLERLRVL